ncbi:large conductance mechanosensitive channel protein MscL [Kitasatospora aureofaciens]|uniref:Large-conductance mechanosensitive channel n=1 Tax=Kitasatospora aureofaciens TaxID=1894 RepID=A0A1E7NA55_KITAU|nr:large conductance mechanosensitive channel protein MscL [Kitasatospora aureofaciens]QEV00205.1 large conductance mechanosensitive channel protein MscL [Streptomyces viridifaciens]ARF79005.1 mechanosensitive ion channel protein [Kitasatospora aureofaciens]OEV37566.1 mechanosensitive ion channel protein [Kitasatospora aureofaciens]UKZ06413.1 large conductance mechanosensitive channel protein MscL [Streptomyces viridifaciens]GGU83571.1 large-conductance mechanosensitive channel [Kitasatospora 
MKGFKEFLLRGNVVELAVAVVIGAAFTNIVNAFVKGVINPIVGAFGTKDLASYSSCLKGPCEVSGTGEVTSGVLILWGSVLSAALQFLITAAVVYFVLIVPMNRMAARRKTVVEEAAEAEAKEVQLLTEIRDALVTAR